MDMESKSYTVGDLSKLLSRKHSNVTEKKKNRKLEAMFSGEQKLCRNRSDVTQEKNIKLEAMSSSTQKQSRKHSDVTDRKKKKKLEVMFSGALQQTIESDESDSTHAHVQIEKLTKDQDLEERKRKKKKKAPHTDVPGEPSVCTISAKKLQRETVRGNPAGYCPPPGIVHEAIAKQKKPKKRKFPEESDEEESPSKRQKTDDPDTRTRPRKKKRDKSKDPRTVFVGNLPISIKKKKLYKVFAEYGEIENIRYRCLPTADPKVPMRVIAIKKDFHPQRNNCVAYVCFKDSLAAKRALKCNGKKIDKLHIRVDLASQDKGKDIKRSVFVGNLPFDIEEEAVRDHFQDCGNVENVRIIRDRKTSLGKGFCYVQFQTTDEVSLALRLHESMLCKRQIRVIRCQQNPVKSAVAKQVDKSGKKLEKREFTKKKPDQRGSPNKNSDSGRLLGRTDRSRPRTHPSNIRGSAFKGKQPQRKDKKLKNLTKGKTFHGKKKTFVTDFGSRAVKSKNIKKNKSKHFKYD